MLIVYFDIRGLMHHKFDPEKQTANEEYYLTVSKGLPVKTYKKRPDLWKNNSWNLYNDNTPSHRATVVTEFEAKKVSCDFLLFPKLKMLPRSTRFDSIQVIKQNLCKELEAIPESAYRKCFED